MVSYAERAWFEANGARSICAALERDLEAHGKLLERGDDQIDSFIKKVNEMLEVKDG